MEAQLQQAHEAHALAKEVMTDLVTLRGNELTLRDQVATPRAWPELQPHAASPVPGPSSSPSQQRQHRHTRSSARL